jgi:hypothetical protein
MQNVSGEKFNQRISVDEKSSENYHPNGKKMFEQVSGTMGNQQDWVRSFIIFRKWNFVISY